MILSPFHPKKPTKYWGTSHPFLSVFFFPRSEFFCYVSASKVDKYVIYSLCVLVHKHNLAISLIALLKVSIIMYSATQNYSSISTNSAINVLDTHLLCIVLRVWNSYLKGILKLLHSEVNVSSLGMCPNFWICRLLIQVILLDQDNFITNTTFNSKVLFYWIHLQHSYIHFLLI